MLWKLKHDIPQKILKNIYYAIAYPYYGIAYPYLHYAFIIRGKASKYFLKKIQVMQNRIIKIINKKSLYKTKVLPLYYKSKVLKLKLIYNLQFINLSQKKKVENCQLVLRNIFKTWPTCLTMTHVWPSVMVCLYT